MKGAVLALLCAAALVSAELNENGCPINPYVDILKSHPICNKFYQCVQGELIERKCASDLTFNEETQACDWAVNVDCGERPVAPESNEESGNDSGANENSNESTNNSNGDSSNEDSENNSSSNESGNDSESNSSSNESENDNNNSSGGNGNAVDAEEICARKDSNGVLVPHEDCDKFYKCAYGVPVALFCNSGLMYNIEKEQCDWPENVNCESRDQGGSGDNGNDNNSGDGDANKDDHDEADEEDGDADKEDEGADKDEGNSNNNNNSNGNPSEAPEICAGEGSDGVLVAHENCNKFYKCSEGVPVALSCNLNLLYNYETEQCDWPQNVNCEGRDGDNGNDNNSENGEADKEDEETDKEDEETNEDGDDNVGGNSDPSQALDICAKEGSDGVLVAHENCNKFYKCSEGVPVALSCNLNLLYNYETEQCDWPQNVNCEGRDGDNGNDNNSENGEADKEDQETDKEDEETNEDGDDNVGGNSDPSQALEICAKEDSDSVLVAHENCNQYYVCKNGSPLTLDCNANLVFNPVSSSCDWPEKVDCSTRRVFTSHNKHVMRFVKLFA